jgi:hypothetical protein
MAQMTLIPATEFAPNSRSGSRFTKPTQPPQARLSGKPFAATTCHRKAAHQANVISDDGFGYV